MGQREILQDPRHPELGIYRHRRKEDGTEQELTLLQESDTPIQRHVKIKANANPHDPKWEQHFESRWGKKMLNSSRGRAKLYRVWLRQDRLCPACQEPITKGTPWDVRHIVKRTRNRACFFRRTRLKPLRRHLSVPGFKLYGVLPISAAIEMV